MIKEKKGKIVKDVTGYKIRIMLVNKTYEIPLRAGKVKKETKKCDSGEFGVYAGRKKLVKSGFKTVLSATDYIESNLVK